MSVLVSSVLVLILVLVSTKTIKTSLHFVASPWSSHQTLSLHLPLYQEIRPFFFFFLHFPLTPSQGKPLINIFASSNSMIPSPCHAMLKQQIFHNKGIRTLVLRTESLSPTEDYLTPLLHLATLFSVVANNILAICIFHEKSFAQRDALVRSNNASCPYQSHATQLGRPCARGTP
ncbi:hypothetical protein V8C37DRAFT_93216 [Trichoderma ceciliae]